jgi:tetratricopeptide (TPR) repeat protein
MISASLAAVAEPLPEARSCGLAVSFFSTILSGVTVRLVASAMVIRCPTPFVPALLLASALGIPGRASAQSNGAQKAAAESLFDDGQRAMKSGQYADACPKFEQSERIDPGIGTLLYLGECYERTGRSASAWATFREAASSARAKGETDRARVANGRADRLEHTLSKLTIVIPAETAQLTGLRVLRDDTPIDRALFGVAIPVDPGKYRIVASADGYATYQTEFELLAHADKKTLSIPALQPLPTPSGTPPPIPASGVIATEPTHGAADARVSDAKPAQSGSHTAAYVTGAIGVVGLGVGSYFGVRAIGKNNDAKRLCPTDDRCVGSGVSLTNQARHAAVASNIAFVGGAALVGLGVVLYLMSDRQQAASLELHPLLSTQVAGIGVGGVFR